MNGDLHGLHVSLQCYVSMKLNDLQSLSRRNSLMNQNQLPLIAKEISFHMEQLISQQSDFS